jgi:hypothetical protein
MKGKPIVFACCSMLGVALSMTGIPQAFAQTTPGFGGTNPAYWQGGQWHNAGDGSGIYGWGGFSGEINASLFAWCDDPTLEHCNDGDHTEYSFHCSSTSGYCTASRERVATRLTGQDLAGCSIFLSCPDGTPDYATDYEYTQSGGGGDCYAQCSSGPANYAEVYVGVSQCYSPSGC